MNRKTGSLVAAIVVIATVPALAQWLNVPTKNTPRTKDGKPDLSAPAPRKPDGKPSTTVSPPPLARRNSPPLQCRCHSRNPRDCAKGCKRCERQVTPLDFSAA